MIREIHPYGVQLQPRCAQHLTHVVVQDAATRARCRIVLLESGEQHFGQ